MTFLTLTWLLSVLTGIQAIPGCPRCGDGCRDWRRR